MIAMNNVSIFSEGVQINNVCLSMGRGDMTLLVGSDGLVLQGILNAICGLIIPVEGNIEVDGIPAHLDAAKQRVMFLLQQPVMNQSLTPRQNLTYYLKLRGIENSVIKDLYRHAKRLLIHEFLDTKSSELGSETIREFEILEALLVQPRYFVLSDFTASVSTSYFRKIINELNLLLNKGSCVVSYTPSYKFAHALTKHIPIKLVLLHENKIIVEGHIEDVEKYLSKENIQPPEPIFGETKFIEIERALKALPER